METCKRWWNFLNGRKTTIGGAFLLAGQILGRFPKTQIVGEILTEIGMFITAGGLVHKGFKVATDTAKG